MDEHHLPGLYMLWQDSINPLSERVVLSCEYTTRCYVDRDEEHLKKLWTSSDWDWDEEHWQEYKNLILPDGLYLIFFNDGMLVATAGAVHNPSARYYFPFGGELANLLVHPDHRQKGLGTALSIHVLQRLVSAGYTSIRVCVQGFRLAAIKTYFKVGFMPFMHQDEVFSRWRSICEQIEVPFCPNDWPSA